MLAPFVGCATIVSGRHSDVTVVSNAPNAQVTIYDRQGKEVTSVNAPSVVRLKRGDGMMPARYTATVEAPGYESEQVAIKSKLNPWMWGNVAFGGLVGLVIDDMTGALWKPEKDTVAVQLEPAAIPGQALQYHQPVMSETHSQPSELSSPQLDRYSEGSNGQSPQAGK